MDAQTYRELREALDAESISYGELVLIESVFATIPDSFLRDVRENAMAGDMLDEIGAYLKLDLCQYESTEPGTLLCVRPMGHDGDHDTPRYAE